jgi:hypothetical protein
VTPIKHLQVAHALRSCHPRFIQVVTLRPADALGRFAPNAALRPKKTEGYTSGVVDVSSTESPPQLSDVLHGLAESQQLLLVKVRALHEAGGSRGDHDAPSQAESRRGPGAAFPSHLEIEPETTGVSPQALTTPVEPEVAPQFVPEIAPKFDARGRDYNFFDELDAKLARMDGLGEEG